MADPIDLHAIHAHAYAQRRTLHAYLVQRADDLRTQPTSPGRDAELAQLEGWIRWVRAAL